MGLADFVAWLFGRRKPVQRRSRPTSAARPAVVKVPPPRPTVVRVPAPPPPPAPAPAPPAAPAPAAPAPAPAVTPKAPTDTAPPDLPIIRVRPLEPPVLKPGHRRKSLRDKRLRALPPDEHSSRRSRSPRLDPRAAGRLFAGTLRTGNTALRALATDDEQLARLGLPVWRDEAELADALQVDIATLHHLSIHSARERSPHYVTFTVPKRSGGERLIMAPKSRLKAVQRRLNALLVDRLPASEYAHGFRSGRSVRSNAEPHIGKSVVLHLDLKDFFPSIHFGRVRGMLIAFGYSYPVAGTLAALMTEAPRQPVSVDGVRYFPPVGPRACPQGAPTSPGLSNAVVVRMDRRLGGLARRFGFAYTRYADDLTFSGGDIESAHALRCLVARIVQSEGFALNRAKTRVMRAGSRQAVTGVVVNAVAGLSRHERRRLRAALHRLRRDGAGPDPRLDGKLGYLHMLNPAQAARLKAQAAS